MAEKSQSQQPPGQQKLLNEAHRKNMGAAMGYTEGFIVAGGIALAGILLQLQFGNLGPSDYSFPVNLIVGILLWQGFFAATSC